LHTQRSVTTGLELRVQPGEHAARVALVDGLALGGCQRGSFDVALGVVVEEAGVGVDVTHRADHLAGEHDVLDRDHLGQQVDARLVVDTGVEVDVVQQVLVDVRLLEHLGLCSGPSGRGPRLRRAE
jgi:hypothetical protein